MIDQLQQIASHSLPGLLGAGFLLALVESAIGALFPGEITIAAIAGLSPGIDRLLMLTLAVTLGAVAGDHIGYALGRRWGPNIRETRIVRKIGVDRWDRATDLLRDRGAAAVFVSRLVPVVRTVMPAAAGAARLPYRIFWPASVAGALVWASLWVTAGSAMGSIVSAGTLPLIIGALVLLGVTLLVARHRRSRKADVSRC